MVRKIACAAMIWHDTGICSVEPAPAPTRVTPKYPPCRRTLNPHTEAMASGSHAAASSVDATPAAAVCLGVVGDVAEPAASDAGPGALAAPRDKAVPLMESIRLLKEQQLRLKTEKQLVQKELKNACKRRNRLKKRARQLTDADLVEVLLMRKDAVPMSVDGEPTAAVGGDANNEEPPRGDD